jgi:hypothetical protein
MKQCQGFSCADPEFLYAQNNRGIIEAAEISFLSLIAGVTVLNQANFMVLV